jgi:FkbM family methyltransferase
MTTRIEGKLVQLQRLVLCTRLYGFRTALRLVLRPRTPGARRAVTLPGGLRFSFRAREDFGVVSHFYREGYRIEDCPERRIRRIMDCGANIGDETARFLCHHPAATILAIEAAPSNFALLEGNFGSVPRVRLVQGGVWPSDGYLKVVAPADGNPESFRVRETDAEHAEVTAYSIPTLMGLMGWEEIDVLKLDVEGAEYELFTRNCDAWVRRVNVFVFEVPDADHPGTTQEIYRSLGDLPFTTFVCGENLVLVKQGLPWRAQRVAGIAAEATGA